MLWSEFATVWSLPRVEALRFDLARDTSLDTDSFSCGMSSLLWYIKCIETYWNWVSSGAWKIMASERASAYFGATSRGGRLTSSRCKCLISYTEPASRLQLGRRKPRQMGQARGIVAPQKHYGMWLLDLTTWQHQGAFWRLGAWPCSSSAEALASFKQWVQNSKNHPPLIPVISTSRISETS